MKLWRSRLFLCTTSILAVLAASGCSSDNTGSNADGAGASGTGGNGAGAGSGSGSGSGTGSVSGNGSGGVPITRGTGGTQGGSGPSAGCLFAPDVTYDPVAAYKAPKSNATQIVTSAADAGKGSLRATLAAAPAGSVIGFSPSLAGKTILLSSVLELPGAVTLDGSDAPGITLDGGDKTQLIHFNGDAPTRIAFFSLVLKRGRTDGSGGAISMNGGALDVEIGGCTFDSNFGSEGGAIRIGYAKVTKVFVHDSIFRNNDGSVPGGGNGFSAGGLSTSGSNVHVARCRFEGNQGPTTGGFYGMHSDPLVEDTVFVNNRSSRPDGGSGAFFADGGGAGDYNTPDNKTPGQISLIRTLFDGNHGAGDDSGSVEAYAYPQDTVTVQDCVFRANVSNPGRAGALFIHADKQVNITRSAFIDNHASASGGAIWADGSALYTIENSLFSGNKADGDLGGALRLNIDDKAKLRIMSSTFVDNQSKDGNGVLWMGGERDARISNSLFVNNTGVSWSQQINFKVADDGGNILWPDPGTDQPTLANAKLVDPKLGKVEFVDGVPMRVPGAGSPALDAAVAPSPTTDQRGAPRGAKPDIGAAEVGAGCGG